MSAPYTSINDLHTDIAKWLEQNIVNSRLSGDKSRQWCIAALNFTGGGEDNYVMNQASLQSVVETAGLNQVYVTAYNADSPREKKDFVLTKLQISLLYSFLKCFIARHRTRIMYYRDDLSQKGARNMYNVGLSQAYHDDLSNLLKGVN